jgi:hypothetical protein
MMAHASIHSSSEKWIPDHLPPERALLARGDGQARVRNDVNTVILAKARIHVDVEHRRKWIPDHLRRARPE